MTHQLQENILLLARPDLSTHILDTSSGLPADNVRVLVERLDENTTDSYVKICEGCTDKDGRIKGDAWNVPRIGAITRDDTLNTIYKFGPMTHPSKNAVYRITFHVKEYFTRNAVDNYFYPFVQIVFMMDERQRYHVPLLLSPFGYSTYRGS